MTNSFMLQRKPQIHRMVHVEIWMGDGEKTLGARWPKGEIQVHDSYKFVSKNYGNMQFYFKSIDTWLQGTCQRFDSKTNGIKKIHTRARQKERKGKICLSELGQEDRSSVRALETRRFGFQ